MAYSNSGMWIESGLRLSAAGLACVLMVACGTDKETESPSESSSSSSSVVSSSSSTVSSSESSSSSSSSVVAEPCSSVLFCDDFEAGSLASWDVSGNAVLSTEEAYSGDTSVKVTGEGGSYNRNFLTLDLDQFPAAQKTLYGRMMVYLTGQNSTSGDFTFVQADGAPKAVSNAPSSVNVMYRMRLDGRHDHIFANYDTYPNWDTDCWAHPTFDPSPQYVMPKDEWACVEWHFDAAADEMMFWRDGTHLNEIDVSKMGDGCLGPDQDNFWYAPQEFSVLHVGVEQYHEGIPSRTMYIDDVQVSDRYIGCP